MLDSVILDLKMILNLKIKMGEMFGFIGFNGVGKSMMIWFLVILFKVMYGEGIVNGCSVMCDLF